jgi:hypothetical protein
MDPLTGLENAMDAQSLTAFVTNHPIGSESTVFYNPKRPTDSLLEPGLNGDDMRTILLLISLHLWVLALWMVGGEWLHRVILTPAAGGTRFRRVGSTIRACLSVRRPIMWAVVTTAAMSLVISLQMVSSISHGSFNGGLLVAGVVFTFGLAVYLCSQWAIWRGDYDLVIDTDKRTITFPKECKDFYRGRTFGWSQVAGIGVKPVVRASTSGSHGVLKRYTFVSGYAPLIRLKGEDDSTVCLAEWNDGGRAVGFANWIRREIGLDAVPTKD